MFWLFKICLIIGILFIIGILILGSFGVLKGVFFGLYIVLKR